MLSSPSRSQNPPQPPPCSPGIPCISYTPGTEANIHKDEDEVGDTCDDDVMNIIHARAFLEAQRENIMNQVFVAKPDSVLEYSCFDEFAQFAAAKAPPIFSETKFFAGRVIEINRFEDTKWPTDPPNLYPTSRTLQVDMGTGHISAGLGGLVMGPLQAYIQGSFSHSYLGGSKPDPGISTGSQPDANLDCSRMQQIWFLAKCVNFDDPQTFQQATKEADPFVTFKELISFDPRRLPQQCPGGTKITQDLIKVATNPAPPYPAYDNNFTQTYPYALVDGVRHPPKNIPPASPGAGTPDSLRFYSDPKLGKTATAGAALPGCPPPVFTGVITQEIKVTGDINSQSRSVSYYKDAVCPTPNCFYNVTQGGATPDAPGEGVCVPITAGGS